jgi:hypothetical protein
VDSLKTKKIKIHAVGKRIDSHYDLKTGSNILAGNVQ